MKPNRIAIVGAVVMIALLAGLALARDYRTGTWAKGETATRKGAWLGVYTQPVDKSVMRELDLASPDGEVITGVVEGSPAERAGFEEDDVIISVDGVSIVEDGDLSDVIGKRNPGDKVSITLLRDGKQKQILVALGDREDYDNDEPIVLSGRFYKKPDIYIRHGQDYGHIGVSLGELNRQLGEYFGVERGRGVLISEVEKGSPAETAGLKAGDVIVGIDNEKIGDIGEVQEIIRDKKEGEKVSISILRDRKPLTITVEVEEQSGWDSGHSWGSTFIVPSVPAVPAIPKVPKIKVRSHSGDAAQFYFDQKELEEDLAELREDLSGLHEELSDELAKEHRQMSKREIRELKRELERLSRDVKRLH